MPISPITHSNDRRDPLEDDMTMPDESLQYDLFTELMPKVRHDPKETA